MWFGVLGPVECIADDGRPVRLGAQKSRLLLARLLCEAGGVVSADRLIDVVWAGEPPRQAANSLQVLVYKLRQALGADRVVRTGQGYQLVVRPGELDADRFTTLVTAARRSTTAGDAAPLYDEALGLWRGDAYGDLAGTDTIRDEATRLDELRLQAVEDRFEAELDLGRHATAVAELSREVAGQPYRERLRGLLMLALYRSGRVAEALGTYRDGRRLLASELGLDPGPALRDLEHAILTGDSGLLAPASPRPAPERPETPAELPPDLATFTGRTAEITRLHEVYAERAAAVALNGPGGSGKSALAIHLAHSMVEDYPDGQLYANLLGTTPGVDAARSVDVLARFLRTLGDQDPPEDLDAAAARLRTLTAGRRVLIVLDNAADTAQVRPLLPARPSTAILTSRAPLMALDGIEHLTLGLQDETDAVGLLARIAGTERVAADPDSALDLVHQCGRTPLAVRIAGARLAARPDWSLARLATHLADEQARLDELQHGDLAVRSSIAVSHHELRTDDRRVFAILGILGIPTFGTAVVAALTDSTERSAERSLDRLVDAQLVQPLPDGRYGLHDLIRLYAHERAVELEPVDHEAAAVRALHWYIATARTADEYARPAGHHDLALPDAALRRQGSLLRSREDAQRWVELETDTLIAVVRQAARSSGPVSLATRPLELGSLVIALYDSFRIFGRWRDFLELIRPLEPVADADVDVRVAARLQMMTAAAYGALGELDRADRQLGSAHRRIHGAGHPHLEASILNALGINARRQGRRSDGIEYFQRGLRVMRDQLQAVPPGNITTNLGICLLEDGELDAAVTALTDALAAHRASRNPDRESRTLGHLAEAYRRSGSHHTALDLGEQALKITRAIGSRRSESYALWCLADTHADLGDGELARAYRRDSLAILEGLRLIEPAESRELLTQPRPEPPRPLR